MPLDPVEIIDTLKSDKLGFILSSTSWKKLAIPQLSWSYLEFTKANLANVPKERGLYIFIIKHGSAFLPEHGYITYVGITGDTSKRTLRDRYSNYLKDKERPKRQSIYYMLNKWSENLYFCYSTISDKSISLSEIETNLLDSLIPPFNQNDFSGEIGSQSKVAWK